MTEPDRLEALKPCPKCRSSKVWIDQMSALLNRWCGTCDDCDFMAETQDTREIAVAAWNTRPIETNSRTGDTGGEWDGPLDAEETAMIDGAWEKHKASAPCDIPPAGWFCTRAPGHDGPCAAYPAPQSITPPEVGGELVERITKALSDYASIGHCRTMARAVIATLSTPEVDTLAMGPPPPGVKSYWPDENGNMVETTPEVVDGTAGLVEALDEVRAKAGLARLFHGSEDATDRALADIIRFINAALSQHRRP